MNIGQEENKLNIAHKYLNKNPMLKSIQKILDNFSLWVYQVESGIH